MNYKLLGKSGLRVSEFALGTMTFGDDDICAKDMVRALMHGGMSEQIVA